MPREGVRYDEFVAFAEAFEAEHGREPSVRAAIAQLGGSATTISAHKRAWRPAAGDAGKAEPGAEGPELPESATAELGEAVESLLKPLWGALLNETNERNWRGTVQLEAQHEIYLEEVEAAVAHARQSERASEALHARLDEREATLAAVRVERETALTQRDEALKDLAKVQGRLGTLTDRVASLERELVTERARVSKQSADASTAKARHEAKLNALHDAVNRAELRAEDAEEDLLTCRVDGQRRLDALSGELADAHRVNQEGMRAMNDLRATHQDEMAAVTDSLRKTQVTRDTALTRAQRAEDATEALRAQLVDLQNALEVARADQDKKFDALLEAIRRQNEDDTP